LKFQALQDFRHFDGDGHSLRVAKTLAQGAVHPEGYFVHSGSPSEFSSKGFRKGLTALPCARGQSRIGFARVHAHPHLNIGAQGDWFQKAPGF
jgi:hypothetical protein